MLANVHAALRAGDVSGAEARCREALARFGPRADVLANLGSVMLARGRFGEAANALHAVHEAAPAHAGIAANYGLALLRDGRADAAVPVLRRAVALDPGHVEAWNNLGLACSAIDDAEGAAHAFATALERAPRYMAALSNWCDDLVKRGRLDDARQVAQRHTSVTPERADPWYKLGYVLVLCDDLGAARAAFEKALALDPRYAPTQHNLGTVALWENRLGDAIGHFHASIALDPRYADPKFGLAAALLKSRRGDEGWAAFEARYAMHDRDLRALEHRLRPWDGNPMPAGTLLVLPEEGLGDVLQFVRFLPEARRRVQRLVMFCDGYWAPLRRMLAETFGDDCVLDGAGGQLQVGAACRLLSLPSLLRLGDRAFDAQPAYLAVPEQRKRAWAERIRTRSGLRVGLCWGGNARMHDRYASLINARRSIGLAQLAPLAEVADVRFFSLQKDGADDVRHAPFAIEDLTDALDDYADTAALMANLDLVVSVDTSIVHCAGAIGRPVWMLDRFDNCWRWGTDAASPGWYESLRVFRQARFRDWSQAVVDMRDALAVEAVRHAARASAG